jgi:hypothetical protein
MELSGACPGMVLAQVGGCISGAGFTFAGASRPRAAHAAPRGTSQTRRDAGGLVGAAAYGLLQPLIAIDGHTLFVGVYMCPPNDDARPTLSTRSRQEALHDPARGEDGNVVREGAPALR